MKSSIFDEVQKSYDLTSLKLIKAAVTRWLSHGKAAQRVLDRFPQLVEALNIIYERKKEPAVQGIIQQLVTPDTIASMCILADILESTNSLQVFLQHAHLNFLDLPAKVDELLTTLELIRENPCRPTSNFGDLDKYLEIASRQERFNVTRSRSTTFSKEVFISNVVKPFISDLIQEIKTAFQIPDHLVGFTAFDPQKLPRDRDDLDLFGTDLIAKLNLFYGEPYELPNNEFLPKVIDSGSLKAEFEIYKIFAFKERFNYELQQRESLDRKLRLKEKIEKALTTNLSKRQRSEKKIQLKELEEELVELRKKQKASFNLIHKEWLAQGFGSKHPVVTKMLEYAALIPPSTAEVERVFSTMKLICTRLRKSLTSINLSHCIRISKFRDLTDNDFREILRIWLSAEDTKSKKRKVSAYFTSSLSV